jgi:hypothetical protein
VKSAIFILLMLAFGIATANAAQTGQTIQLFWSFLAAALVCGMISLHKEEWTWSYHASC